MIRIAIPNPKVRAVAVIVRKADIDLYGRVEARRRAYAAAGVEMPPEEEVDDELSG